MTNRKTILAVLMLVAFSAPALAQTTNQKAPEKLALIVGNNAYGGKLELASCVNDATAMQVWLRKSGYEANEIDLQTNVTRPQMLAAMAKLQLRAKQIRPRQVVFFYSGHGSTIADDDGDEARRDPGDNRDETFLMVPGNGPKTPESVTIRDDEFFLAMNEVAKYTDQLIVVLDSCHSGGAFRSIADDADDDFVRLAEGEQAKFVSESRLREELARLGVAEEKLKSLYTRAEEEKEAKANTGGTKGGIGEPPTDLEIPTGCSYVFLAACDQREVAISGNAKSTSKFTGKLIGAVDTLRGKVLAEAEVTQLTLPVLKSHLKEELFRYKQSPVVFAVNATHDFAVIGDLFPDPKVVAAARARNQELLANSSLQLQTSAKELGWETVSAFRWRIETLDYVGQDVVPRRQRAAHVFDTGETYRIRVDSLSRDVYLYGIYVDAAGEYHVISPSDDAAPVLLKQGGHGFIPEDGDFQFAAEPGTERDITLDLFKLIISPEPLRWINTKELRRLPQTLKAANAKSKVSWPGIIPLDHALVQTGVNQNPGQTGNRIQVHLDDGEFGQVVVFASKTKNDVTPVIVDIPLRHAVRK